ncbi:MAG TPA: sigma-70 family RNA polymerase sigma factor [Thermoleophilaceae bacterium]|jgi:RNA polymerase sigma-70 factor (ECF subfamily)
MTSAPTTSEDQRGLIAAAQAGDERAFRRLVEPYRRPLEVHCYRMLGSLHDAEDVLQETLLRAWRSLDRFERRSSMHTWLYRIATNACLDELERRPHRPEPVQPYPDQRLEDLPSPVADPAARYALHEGMELAFLTAIQQLPGRQRAVLILRDVLGWSAREVADLLDTTVAGTNSALQRARATIDSDVSAHASAPRATHERELLRRYVDVWQRADMDGFIELLREDAILRMPPQPSVVGAPALGEFWFAPRPEHQPCAASNSRLVPTRANGRPAVAIYKQGEDGGFEPFAVMLIETDGEKITGFDAWVDADLVERFTEEGS